MKILHTADWHLGQFKGPVENGVNLRSQDTIKCLEYMLEMARKEEPDLICVSGDIFHQEQIGPVRYSDEMVTASYFIDELSKCSKFVVVMRGTPNHDGGGQFRVLTKMLSHNKKVAVVTTPQVIETPIATIACIPGFDKQEFRSKFPGLSSEEENLVWTENISSMVLGLKAQCDVINKMSILMAHYTVPGCNMESGQTSFFSNFEPVIPREVLQTAAFDAVLLGHVHRPQKIKGIDNVFYAGAINAMNFNDEDQVRGFYVHEFTEYAGNASYIWDGKFCETPYREFQTIKWDKEDVAEYLKQGKLFLSTPEFAERINNKIVRIQYTCTSEQKKAMNIPMLQTDLYDIGAFYVADIEAEQMIDLTNRGLLSDESDPLINLKKWVNEKCYPDADKIVEMAEPIITTAMGKSTTAEIHGLFKPISIAVKNYRNYKEETFDFEDVSFCTINGVNGAGKSSLFMDAIVDCLFEETREGDNKAWIRGTEDARSGSIEFVFEIGEKRFRVVRTRTKSGRPTLNLSQMDEGGSEWLNLSKERTNDTQAEIQKILGMDSMTFRSCALIMQDQYGLFLQAKKDERIAILGNLLGLGIYGIMELETRKCLGDAKRELAKKKEAVKVKKEFVESKGNPEQELEEVEKSLTNLGMQISTANEEQISIQKKMAEYKMAKERRDEFQKTIEDGKEKKKKLESDIITSRSMISNCDVILSNEDLIKKKAGEYEASVNLSQELAKDQVRYESEKRSLEECNQQLTRYQNIIDNSNLRNEQIANLIKENQGDAPEDLQDKLAELASTKVALEDVRKKKDRHSEIVQEANQTRTDISEKIAKLKSQLQLAKADLSSFEEQKTFMENAGCVNIAKADCRFLLKAKDDVRKIDKTKNRVDSLQLLINEVTKTYEDYVAQKKMELSENGYNKEEEQNLLNKISSLEKYEKMKESYEQRKVSVARLEAEKESNDKTIASCKENVSTVKSQAQEITDRVNELSGKVKQYTEAKKKVDELKVYQERLNELPVYKERKKNEEEKLRLLEINLESNEQKMLVATADLFEADEMLKSMGMNDENALLNIEQRIKALQAQERELQVSKGTLMQKAEDVQTMMKEIELLKSAITAVADLAAKYEILKQAFSQDGVPHQIIRNIIPHIEDHANNILGAMTSGTMGVEFVMEKTVKGKDGDKATLDVLINEYGKTTLPYASKSGGEKVKASLAVILALAEVKTSSAGIQLGMLFIDEPPFLDEDGVQAYVDSLETIRQRYPDVKIMAITHDEAMKARFSQSVTVIKTDDGSRVIY